MGSKWFSKIGIALAGIAMAVGAGVGLGQKEFKNVEAAEAAYYTLSTAKSTQNTGYASTYDVSVTNSEMTKDWNIPGNQNFEGYVRIGGTGLNGEASVL